MPNKKQNKSIEPYIRYNYGQRPNPNTGRKPPQRRYHRFILWLIVIILVALVGHTIWAREVAAHDRSVAANELKIKTEQIAQFSSTTNGVIDNNSAITFEVSAIDLSNNSAKNFGGNTPMIAASVNKIITACDFLRQVETGQESLSETINGSTAKYELQQMIVVSDDNAWTALNNELGYSQLQSYGQSLGLASFNAVANTISTSDVANVLAKLYEGKLLNSNYTNLLLSYLKQANYRQYIVPAVPSGDVVYHKIGLLNDNVNDAAIISNGSQAFVLVIFTNGNGVYNWPIRAQLMQEIATAGIKAYLD